MTVVSFAAFHETYAPLILGRRADTLRSETGDVRYHTAVETLEAGRTVIGIIGQSLSRPLRLLAFRPIIQVLTLLSGFYYGILYIILSTFAKLWIFAYHERVEISGLHYIAVALGEIAGYQIGGSIMDRVFARLRSHRNGKTVPEFHIPLMIPGALLAPIGMAVSGRAAQTHLHWIVFDVEVFLACFGMQMGGQPMQAHIVDSYQS